MHPACNVVPAPIAGLSGTVPDRALRRTQGGFSGGEWETFLRSVTREVAEGEGLRRLRAGERRW